MKLVKISGIKKDKYQLFRLNWLLNHFLQMVGEVDAKLQSADIEGVERSTLEENKMFFLEEYSKIKEELDFMLHTLGLDRKGDWILWRGKIRRGLRVISGKRVGGITQRNQSCLKLVKK